MILRRTSILEKATLMMTLLIDEAAESLADENVFCSLIDIFAVPH
jgi:hypothetical protein